MSILDEIQTLLDDGKLTQLNVRDIVEQTFAQRLQDGDIEKEDPGLSQIFNLGPNSQIKCTTEYLGTGDADNSKMVILHLSYVDKHGNIQYMPIFQFAGSRLYPAINLSELAYYNPANNNQNIVTPAQSGGLTTVAFSSTHIKDKNIFQVFYVDRDGDIGYIVRSSGTDNMSDPSVYHYHKVKYPDGLDTADKKASVGRIFASTDDYITDEHIPQITARFYYIDVQGNVQTFLIEHTGTQANEPLNDSDFNKVRSAYPSSLSENVSRVFSVDVPPARLDSLNVYSKDYSIEGFSEDNIDIVYFIDDSSQDIHCLRKDVRFYKKIFENVSSNDFTDNVNKIVSIAIAEGYQNEVSRVRHPVFLIYETQNNYKLAIVYHTDSSFNISVIAYESDIKIAKDTVLSACYHGEKKKFIVGLLVGETADLNNYAEVTFNPESLTFENIDIKKDISDINPAYNLGLSGYRDEPGELEDPFGRIYVDKKSQIKCYSTQEDGKIVQHNFSEQFASRTNQRRPIATCFYTSTSPQRRYTDLFYVDAKGDIIHEWNNSVANAHPKNSNWHGILRRRHANAQPDTESLIPSQAQRLSTLASMVTPNKVKHLFYLDKESEITQICWTKAYGLKSRKLTPKEFVSSVSQRGTSSASMSVDTGKILATYTTSHKDGNDYVDYHLFYLDSWRRPRHLTWSSKWKKSEPQNSEDNTTNSTLEYHLDSIAGSNIYPKENTIAYLYTEEWREMHFFMVEEETGDIIRYHFHVDEPNKVDYDNWSNLCRLYAHIPIPKAEVIGTPINNSELSKAHDDVIQPVLFIDDSRKLNIIFVTMQAWNADATCKFDCITFDESAINISPNSDLVARVDVATKMLIATVTVEEFSDNQVARYRHADIYFDLQQLELSHFDIMHDAPLVNEYHQSIALTNYTDENGIESWGYVYADENRDIVNIDARMSPVPVFNWSKKNTYEKTTETVLERLFAQPHSLQSLVSLDLSHLVLDYSTIRQLMRFFADEPDELALRWLDLTNVNLREGNTVKNFLEQVQDTNRARDRHHKQMIVVDFRDNPIASSVLKEYDLDIDSQQHLFIEQIQDDKVTFLDTKLLTFLFSYRTSQWPIEKILAAIAASSVIQSISFPNNFKDLNHLAFTQAEYTRCLAALVKYQAQMPAHLSSYLRYLLAHGSSEQQVYSSLLQKNFSQIIGALSTSEFLVNRAFGHPKPLQTVAKDSLNNQPLADVLELDYARAHKAETVHGPAAYLFELLRVIMCYVNVSSFRHSIYYRRPDIFDIPLDAAHTEKLIPHLSIVNYVLARHLAPMSIRSEKALTEHDYAELMDIYERAAFQNLPVRNIFRWPFELQYETLSSYLPQIDTNLYALLEKITEIAGTKLGDVSHRSLDYLAISKPCASILADSAQGLDDVDESLLTNTELFCRYTHMSYATLGELLRIQKAKPDRTSLIKEPADFYINLDNPSEPLTLELDRVQGQENISHLSKQRLRRIGVFEYLRKRTQWDVTELDEALSVLHLRSASMSHDDLQKIILVKQCQDAINCDLNELLWILKIADNLSGDENKILTRYITTAIANKQAIELRWHEGSWQALSASLTYVLTYLFDKKAAVSQLENLSELLRMKEEVKVHSLNEQLEFLYYQASGLLRLVSTVTNVSLKDLLALPELGLNEIASDLDDDSVRGHRLLQFLFILGQQARWLDVSLREYLALLRLQRTASVQHSDRSYDLGTMLKTAYDIIYTEPQSICEQLLNLQTHKQWIDRLAFNSYQLSYIAYADIISSRTKDISSEYDDIVKDFTSFIANNTKQYNKKITKDYVRQQIARIFQLDDNLVRRLSDIDHHDAEEGVNAFGLGDLIIRSFAHISEATRHRSAEETTDTNTNESETIDQPTSQYVRGMEKTLRAVHRLAMFIRLMKVDQKAKRYQRTDASQAEYDLDDVTVLLALLKSEMTERTLSKAASIPLPLIRVFAAYKDSQQQAKDTNNYVLSLLHHYQENSEQDTHKLAKALHIPVDIWRMLNSTFALVKESQDITDNIRYLERINQLVALYNKLHKDHNFIIKLHSYLLSTDAVDRQYALERLAYAVSNMTERYEASAHDKAVRKLLERKRDVLVDAFIRQQQDIDEETPLTTPERVSEYLLIDVKIAGIDNTSPIAQAHTSLQWYLRRCRTGIEQSPNMMVDYTIPNTWWDRVMNYRVWEANRRVFLSPENFLAPEIRSRQSSEFKQLAHDLSKAHIAEENISQAFRNYLAQIIHLSQLQPCSVCSSPVNERGQITHYIVASTRTEPKEYYYRTVVEQTSGVSSLHTNDFSDWQRQAKASLYQDLSEWSFWQKITLSIQEAQLLPGENPTSSNNFGLNLQAVYANDRMYLIWQRISRRTVRQYDANETNDSRKPAPVEHHCQISCTYQKVDGSWQAPLLLLDNRSEPNAELAITPLKVTENANVLKIGGRVNEGGKDIWIHLDKFDGIDEGHESSAAYVLIASQDDKYYDNLIKASAVRPYQEYYAQLMKRIAQYPFDNWFKGVQSHLDNSAFDDPQGGYYWELRYYAPLFIANTLRSQHQHKLAQQWYETLFNPNINTYGSTRTLVQADHAMFDFAPLFASYKNITQQLSSEQMRRIYREQAFNSHALAQHWLLPYKKYTVMQYLRNLLAWGDAQFSRNTREALAEASQLYFLALELIGDPPRALHSATYTRPSRSAAELLLRNLQQPGDRALVTKTEGRLYPYNYIPAGYFQLSENDEFMQYWTDVSDRLYKLRHSLSLAGMRQQLDLFSPELDPHQLVRAAATRGGDFIQSVLDDLSGKNRPHQRFSVLIEYAKQFTNQLISLGRELYAALERQDNQRLVDMNNQFETELMPLLEQAKRKQIEAATVQIQQLSKQTAVVVHRRDTFADYISGSSGNSLGLSKLEISALAIEGAADVAELLGMGLHAAAKAGGTMPMIISTAVPPVASQIGTIQGGAQVKSGMESAAIVADIAARGLHQASNILQQTAGYERRKRDWEFQRDQASHELEALAQQTKAAELQLKIAELDMANLLKSFEQQRARHEYYLTSFTNMDLYNWYVDTLVDLYSRAYDTALDMARQAEKAYHWEISQVPPRQWTGFWNASRRGLLAGEQLHAEILEMEKDHLERDKRKLQITKTISVKEAWLMTKITNGDYAEKFSRNDTPNETEEIFYQQLKSDPQIQKDFTDALTAEGGLSFKLDALDFNGDFNSSGQRRMKMVRMSVPALSGAYQSVNLVLSEVKSQEQIAISTSAHATGMFEPNYNSPKYLPFEGYDPATTWSLAIAGAKPGTDDTPAGKLRQAAFAKRQQMYQSIRDIVMMIDYSLDHTIDLTASASTRPSV